MSEVISISKDSLQLLGNGSRIQADSSYRGAALEIGPTVKQVMLDSLVFENFDVAIISHSKNLSLRNVRFINCRVPVQYNVSFADTVVTGRFADSIFISRLPAN
jgi:hypothetical protein